ncbi:MAG: pilus assembly protein PilM [Gammaproteobacteria bacterium]
MQWVRNKRRETRLLGVTTGDQSVAAAVVERLPGQPPRLQWTAHASGDDRAALLRQLGRRRELRQVRCAGAVAPGEYSLVMVDAPQVPPAELREAVRWRVNELIDFHVDDAVIDVFDVPAANVAHHTRLYAVAARAQSVRQVVDAFNEAGFRLEYVDIPEFALRNLATLLSEDAGGVALVALERERGLLTITRQGNLYLSRRFDYGTDRLLGDGETEVSNEREGLLDSLVIEIQRSLDYYERHFAQPAVHGVVLAPAARDMTVAAPYLQSQLGLPVRGLDLNELLDPPVPLSPAEQAHCLAAVGLALRDQRVAL